MVSQRFKLEKTQQKENTPQLHAWDTTAALRVADTKWQEVNDEKQGAAEGKLLQFRPL